MVADRLVDVEAESRVNKDRLEDLLVLKNKNIELEKQKDALQNDYQKLEKLVEKILAKIEIVTDFSDKKPSSLPTDESSSQIAETDQPKLF